MTESNAGDFLEEERGRDPIERMVASLEKYLGHIGAKSAKERLTPIAASISYLGPLAKEFNIRVIENGFLLILSTPSPYSRTREVFCQDKVALIEKITQEIEAFVKASQEPIPPIHGVDAFKDDIATAS